MPMNFALHCKTAERQGKNTTALGSNSNGQAIKHEPCRYIRNYFGYVVLVDLFVCVHMFYLGGLYLNVATQSELAL